MTNMIYKNMDTVDQEAVDDMSSQYNESTKMSWFWAFMFGPIYFMVHGFWARAFVLIGLNLLVIGFFIAPFMAYPAWRIKAQEQATRVVLAR